MQNAYNKAKADNPKLKTEVFLTKHFFIYQPNVYTNKQDLVKILTIVRQEYDLAACVVSKYKEALAKYLKSDALTDKVVDTIIEAFFTDKKVESVMPLIESLPNWCNTSYDKDYEEFASLLNKFEVLEDICTADVLKSFAKGRLTKPIIIKGKMLNAFTLIIGIMKEKSLLPEKYQATMERKLMVMRDGSHLTARQFKNSKRNYWHLISEDKLESNDNLYENIINHVRDLEYQGSFASRPVIGA